MTLEEWIDKKITEEIIESINNDEFIKSLCGGFHKLDGLQFDGIYLENPFDSPEEEE